MKPEPLKNCPFCGGKPKRHGHVYKGKFLGVDPDSITQGIYEQLHWYTVKCTKCGISQPRQMYSTREESDRAWNRRE